MTDGVMKTCRDTFTTPFTYLPKVGSGVSMKGIFDAAFVTVQIIDSAPVQSIGPQMGVRVADLVAASITPGPGDRIQVGAITYTVDEYRPDGEAGAVIIMNEIDDG